MGRPLQKQKYLGANAPHQIQSTIWGAKDTSATAGFLARQNSDDRFLTTTVNGTSLTTFVNTAPTAPGQCTVKFFPANSSVGSGAVLSPLMALNAVTLVNPGTGYTANSTIHLVGGTSSNAATISVDTITGNGAVATFHIVATPNQNYSALPANAANVQVTGGSGTGASFNTSFNLANVAITAGGSGYTTANIVIEGGNGNGAHATATLTANVITAVTVTAAGAGYTAIPTVVVEAELGTTEYVKHLASYRVITQSGRVYRWLPNGVAVPPDYANINWGYLDTL